MNQEDNASYFKIRTNPLRPWADEEAALTMRVRLEDPHFMDAIHRLTVLRIALRKIQEKAGG